jgi:MtN3 and saliva related transmembrane protein
MLKLVKTKNSQNVSLVTFLGFNAIQLFVIFHGVIHKDSLLIYGNLIRFIICAMVSYLIILYRFQKIFLLKRKR